MQSLAVALIALGVLIVVIVVVLWRRGPRPVDPGPLPPPPPDRPVLRVVALGLEGAGKTVLLASQFHTLSQPAPGRRFFLDAEWQQDQKLARMYAAVSDTSAPWPKATRIGNQETFLFSCRAHDRAGAERTLFQLSYLDYAGELLEAEFAADDPPAPGGGPAVVNELTARVEDAHALLLVLDGRRMLQLLRHEHEGHDYFDRRLAPLLALARRAECPVQLILTKWDLVCTFDHTGEEELLQQVRERLMDYGRIGHLVQAHGHRHEVRLIPVSAVGRHFVDPDPEGKMIKRSDGRVEPVHVDVPLCAVLPDVVTHLEHALDPSVRAGIDQEIQRHTFRDAAAIVRSVLSSPAGQMLQKALTGLVGDQIVKLFVDLLVRTRLPDAPPSPGEEQRPRDRVEEEQQLRSEVLGDMKRIVRDLEERLPSSVLDQVRR